MQTILIQIASSVFISGIVISEIPQKAFTQFTLYRNLTLSSHQILAACLKLHRFRVGKHMPARLPMHQLNVGTTLYISLALMAQHNPHKALRKHQTRST